jgi:UDP-N-acetylmuramoyl-L-alanyl-D-glutamate--2,6-diaminopimelate ligase
MLEKIKNFPLVKFFYNLPGAARLYHFLWAFLGAVAAGFPSRYIYVIGITGTKGKTTTLEVLNSILEEAGKKTALLSSLRVKIDDRSEKNKLGNSMPGRAYIQRFLRKAVNAGCKYALIEVTSQGVVFHRHRFINWNVGILTNLAPEHIEAHGSFEKYREAKLNFLKYVGMKGGRIFINCDDANADFFVNKLGDYKPMCYSKKNENVLRILPNIHRVHGVSDQAPPKFRLSDFNKENVAGAVAAASYIGISEKIIEEALRSFGGVRGRFEFVQHRPFAVVVDYAHTPDSLKRVYEELRNYSAAVAKNSPRMICVLGAAGGGRDKWKRPVMGKIAAEYCEEVILTNEDPYGEKPEKILDEISSGFSKLPITNRQLPKVYKILDRREAIKKAISLAGDGDVVVCTGKGSEDWIHVARGKKIPWDERAVIEEELKNRKLGSM